jgi:hypothetical protein
VQTDVPIFAGIPGITRQRRGIRGSAIETPEIAIEYRDCASTAPRMDAANRESCASTVINLFRLCAMSFALCASAASLHGRARFRRDLPRYPFR